MRSGLNFIAKFGEEFELLTANLIYLNALVSQIDPEQKLARLVNLAPSMILANRKHNGCVGNVSKYLNLCCAMFLFNLAFSRLQ